MKPAFALSTRRKLQMAALVSRGLRTLRGLVGDGPEVMTKRRGLLWKLDLREGIELAIYLGLYERTTTQALTRLLSKDMIALDIGANIGALTLPMALQVGDRGRIIAFEPTAYAFTRLRANIALNPDIAPRITCHHMMLSDSNRHGLPAIASSWPLAQTGDTDPGHGGRMMPTAGATVSSLDDFIAAEKPGHVDVIKLDVDGNELLVLRGAQKTLATFRPILVMEFAPYVHPQNGANTFDALLSLLRGLGYRAEDCRAGAPVPLTAHAIKGLCAAAGGINLVLKPAG